MVIVPTPIVRLFDPLFNEKGITVSVKRDDLTHPEVMGNKWRKLKYNLTEAKKYAGLLTFGGAFSNHIAATAAACRIQKIKCVGIIRGEELTPQSNPTLQKAAIDGMELKFVSRDEYKKLREHPLDLAKSYPSYYVVPEGGTNSLALKGVKEIWEELEDDFDFMACPVGTGGTLAGLLSANRKPQILGFSSLKGTFIHKELNTLFEMYHITNSNYQVLDKYHFGGYGVVTEELLDFVSQFEKRHQIPLEPVYTGKMLFGLYDLIRSDFFEKDVKIVVLHTGGLQGNAGFRIKQNKKIR